MTRFFITYEIVTPESAEHGDVAERGYVQPGGMFHPLETVEMKRDRAALEFTLRDAVNTIGCVEDSGSWFSEIDPRQNYQTGAETRFDLHPPRDISPASYGRLFRLLKAH